MKHPAIATRPLLHLGGALPPGHGVGLQALFHGLAWLLPMLRQAVGVFNGHACALRQIRQHRVRGVPQQSDFTFDHFSRLPQWRLVKQGPGFAAVPGHAHQLLQRGTTGVHGGLQIEGGFFGAAHMFPARGSRDVLGFHQHHQVQQVAATDRVVHHVQTRAQPQAHAVPAPHRRQLIALQHAAVGPMAAGHQGLRSPHLMTHPAADAIGANQGHALHGP